jgi:(E)-4-hydroxy-3-methylbut-2-enyl-diphosphate synthase
VSRYSNRNIESPQVPSINKLPYDPTHYKRHFTHTVSNIGGNQVPVVVADFSKIVDLRPGDLTPIGYHYQELLDKWNIADAAADYIYCKDFPSFSLPGTLKVLLDYSVWKTLDNKFGTYPLFSLQEFMIETSVRSSEANWVMLDAFSDRGDDQSLIDAFYNNLTKDSNVIICLSSRNINAMQSVRRRFIELMERGITNPVVIMSDSNEVSEDRALLHFSVETGALLLDGLGDGIALGHHHGNDTYRTDMSWLNRLAFGILQATRTRISKTEYISCPSCGRTLFDLQETTARIRAVTHHLKGVKIAIMGCIVNGPGEMADADFGYVGSGVDKITLYKGKEVVKRNLSSEVAVDELIALIKEHGAWVDPAVVA